MGELPDWKNDIKDLLGDDEPTKLNMLDDEITRCRRSNLHKEIALYGGFVVLVAVLIAGLWCCTNLKNTTRGDIANSAIAVTLGVCSLLTPKLQTINQRRVQDICGEPLHVETVEKMQAHVGAKPDRLRKVLAVLAAIALLTVVVSKNVASDANTEKKGEKQCLSENVLTWQRDVPTSNLIAPMTLASNATTSPQ